MLTTNTKSAKKYLFMAMTFVFCAVVTSFNCGLEVAMTIHKPNDRFYTFFAMGLGLLVIYLMFLTYHMIKRLQGTNE